MKFELLSHCSEQADAAVLRVDFGPHTRVSTINRSSDFTRSSAAAAPGFFARMRSVFARLFRRNSDSDGHAGADVHDRACRCDVEAR
ncbi:MAG TPA: hypothetical protein VGN31_20625, partial [Paraburkholderia sp.]